MIEKKKKVRSIHPSVGRRGEEEGFGSPYGRCVRARCAPPPKLRSGFNYYYLLLLVRRGILYERYMSSSWGDPGGDRRTDETLFS